jgi:hypothetical protein
MLVVDASVLFEVVASTPRSEALRERLAADDDQVAPHLIDAEVFGIIRNHHERGWLDRTAAEPGGRRAAGPARRTDRPSPVVRPSLGAAIERPRVRRGQDLAREHLGGPVAVRAAVHQRGDDDRSVDDEGHRRS